MQYAAGQSCASISVNEKWSTSCVRGVILRLQAEGDSQFKLKPQLLKTFFFLRV